MTSSSESDSDEDVIVVKPRPRKSKNKPVETTKDPVTQEIAQLREMIESLTIKRKN